MTEPFEVCLYYLEQEEYSPGLRADKYFAQVLEHIRHHGHHQLTAEEARVIMAAADRRGKIDDLEEAIIGRENNVN